jgi:hypothetical protein
MVNREAEAYINKIFSLAIITISGLDYINNPIIWTRGSGSTIPYHLYKNYNLNTYKYSKHINDSIIPNFQIHKTPYKRKCSVSRNDLESNLDMAIQESNSNVLSFRTDRDSKDVFGHFQGPDISYSQLLRVL